jgi:hypothetical protein
MRRFFLLLILANIGLLTVLDSTPTATPAPVDPPEAVQGLTLVSELSPQQPLDPRPVMPHASVPEAVRMAVQAPPANLGPTRAGACYRIEGLRDAKALEQVNRHLAAEGVDVRASGKADFERRRYWVVLPPFRSREQAAPVMARLRAAGIKDFYFVPNGENKNTLSLGLFSTPEAARRRVAQLSSLKLTLHTREVISPGRRFYLEVTWSKPGQALSKLLQSAATPELRIRSCNDAQ